MKTKILSFTTFILVGLSAAAQYTYNYNAIPVMDYFRIEQMTEEKLTKVLTEENIEGSPYLEKEFRTGAIYTTSKQKVVDIEIRYNIYNDDLEFKNPDNQIMAINDPGTIELADFGAYQMSYLPYETGGKVKNAFFKIIEKGTASLYAKPDVFFQKEEQGDGIKPGKPAQFISKPDVYYISVDEQPAIKISRKKDLLNVFQQHENAMASFIKKNNIKPSDVDQLRELVQFYNTL